MNTVKIQYYKPSGKYYSEETVNVPSSCDNVVGYILKATNHRNKGMILSIFGAGDWTDGYPVIVRPENRF